MLSRASAESASSLGIGDFGACGEAATLVHEIQGSGTSSPIPSRSGVIVEGVVVGDFQDPERELGGFFLQEEDSDADDNPTSSEGIFVFDAGFGVDVDVGEIARVQGDVREFFGLTEIGNVARVARCGRSPSASPARVELPVADLRAWEHWEGMRVRIEQTLVATGHFHLGRFGEVTLSIGERLWHPTQRVLPGDEAQVLKRLNELRRILLDDGSRLRHPAPPPYLGADGTLRLGDELSGLEGVVGFAFGRYRIHPTHSVSLERVNARRDLSPDVGGTLRASAWNLENYFNGDGRGGGFPTPRGASSPRELERQRAKLVEALVRLDADLVGLIEIENDGTGPGSAIRELADALNERVPFDPYDVVDPGRERLGSHAIAVGLLYRPGAARPLGPAAILDSRAHPGFDDSRNRPSLAQTLEAVATGERFTVVVNHFKSKGSPCDAVGDPDRDDGQGSCSATRREAARALAEWLATDPTSRGEPDVLIVGDLNAYALEDPLQVLRAAGYADLIQRFEGRDAQSFVFDGEAGRLDHALASASLLPHVSGAAPWHVNADEPPILDYREANPSDLYVSGPFRSSDHDPVLVGLFPDADGDGVTDALDACPQSQLGDTVVLDDCDSGVANPLDALGCTLADRLLELTRGARSHGELVRQSARLLAERLADGSLEPSAQGAIQACVARSPLP